MRTSIVSALALATLACATPDKPAASGSTPAFGVVLPQQVSAPGTGTGPAVPLKSMLPPGVAVAAAGTPAAAPEKFGAAVSAGEALPIQKVLAAPDTFSGKKVLVDAKVRAACTKKGCWMEVAEGTDKGSPGARVTFKDYGFFVPKDCAGAAARVEGVVEVKTLDKAEADHMKSEGGTVALGADGTAREIRIVATGVELRR